MWWAEHNAKGGLSMSDIKQADAMLRMAQLNLKAVGSLVNKARHEIEQRVSQANQRENP